MSGNEQITELLREAAKGDRAALEDVTDRVYSELEALAASKMRRRFGSELAGATLEPAALVNETLFKLVRDFREFENRRHFFAFSHQVMSRVLIDYERRRAAEKRGGRAVRVTLADFGRPSDEISALELVQLFERLERVDARKAEVVRLRVFWGFDNSEIAAALEVSIPTVERDWRFAQHWLATRLSPQD